MDEMIRVPGVVRPEGGRARPAPTSRPAMLDVHGTERRDPAEIVCANGMRMYRRWELTTEPTLWGIHDCDRAALHRLRRAHPRAPDRRCPTTRRRSTATASGTSRPTRPARSGSHYDGNRIPANFMAAAGTAGLSDEDRARSFRGEMRYTEVRPAAYNAKARLQDMDQDGIDLAVLYPTMLLGLQSYQRRRLRRGAGARVQRLVLRPHPGGRGPAVRRRRGAADARARRRRARRGRDPSRRRAAGHGVGVHAAEPVGRLAAVQRPGLRPASGRRRTTPGCPIALHPFLVARPARARAWACASRRPRRADGSYVDNFDPERHRRARRATARSRSRAASVLFTQAIANPVDVMSCIAYLHRRRRVRALPRRQVHLPRGQRRLDRAVARAPRPPLQEVPVGGAGSVDAAVGVHEAAVLDQLRPRRGDARVSPRSRRSSAPTASSGRRDYPHPDAKFPGVTEELTEALEGLDLRAEAGRSPARARSRSTAST